MAATLPLVLEVATLERVVLRPDSEFSDDELADPERVFGEGTVAGFVLDPTQIYDQL